VLLPLLPALAAPPLGAPPLGVPPLGKPPLGAPLLATPPLGAPPDELELPAEPLLVPELPHARAARQTLEIRATSLNVFTHLILDLERRELEPRLAVA